MQIPGLVKCWQKWHKTTTKQQMHQATVFDQCCATRMAARALLLIGNR